MTNSSSPGNTPGTSSDAATILLTPSQIAELFPFHFAFGVDFRLVQLGRSLAKICPELVIGSDVREYFLIERPSASLDWLSIGDGAGKLFILRHRISPQIRLRGQMIIVPGQQCTLFLCSPWLPEAGALRALGLTIDDFPAHDSMPEFLQVVQTQTHALGDLRQLTERLRTQREELKASNGQLAAREKELYRLSLIAARTINAVVIADRAGRIEWVNESFERMTGYTLDEVKGMKPGAFLQGAKTDPTTIAYMRGRILEGREFQAEVLNYSKNGRTYWVSIEAQPILTAEGTVEAFMAIETDISARKEADLTSHLAYSVTKMLAESTSVELALPRILEEICGALGYQSAAIWRLCRGERELFCWHQWRTPELAGCEFDRITRQLRYPAGVGLPGLVWQTGEAKWVESPSRPAYPRAGAAAEAGLISGFAVPVEIGGKIHGVMEFLSREAEEPSALVVETITALGNQIGQFIEGREAESQRGEALALLDSTIESTLEGILVTDLEGNPIRFNRRWAELWRLPRELQSAYDRDAHLSWLDAQIANSGQHLRRLVDLLRNVEESSDDLLRLMDGRIIQAVSTPHRMAGRTVGRIWIHRDISQSFAEQAEREKLLATLNATLEATTDGILVTGLDRHLVTCNRRFLEMWGFTPQDTEDRTPGALRAAARRQVSHPDVFERRVQWFFDNPNEFGSDVIHLLDGRIYERETYPQCVGTRIIGRMWSYRDVTERWRAEAVLRESEERYRVVAETASDGIVTLDQDFRIEYANASAHRIFGCQDGALAGTSVFEWFPEELREIYRRILARLMRSTEGKLASIGIEVVGQTASGVRVPLEVSYGESSKAARRVFTAIIRDISARKAVEAQLKSAIREAESANKAKGDFLANMSHEIRTPLNAVLGITELLRSTRLDLNQREMLDSVAVGAESLRSLINDLLDFSKIEAGQVDIETAPFDPSEVAEQAIEILRGRTWEKGLDVYFIPRGNHFLLQGDANRIRQILINLISNAKKFTEAGNIIIRLELGKVIDGRVEITYSVEDTGIGIPEHAQAQVFQKFFRVDAAVVRKAGGAGLGLSISRLLAEAMGGALTLESEVGVGSRFSLKLSLPVIDAFAVQPPIANLLLLTVPWRKALTESALTAAGYSVTSFTEATAALEFADALENGALFVFDQDCDGTNEQLRQLARLTSLGQEARSLQISGPSIARRTIDGLPGRSGTLEFPLTPWRVSRAMTRLFTEDDSAQDISPDAGPNPPSPRRRALRVLLVEDNPAGQYYANRVLARRGYDVTAVGTVSTAVEAAKQERFDVILMDLMLPDGSGFDATRQIRAHEQGIGRQRSPVVALTAHAMQTYREQAFEADMDDYITKPFRPDTLTAAVERWAQPNRPEALPVETVFVDLDLADLVPGYLASVGNETRAIRDAVAAGNLQQAARLAHNLKGTGSSYGFAKISNAGAAMERAAKAGSAAEVDSLAEALMNWLAQLRWEPAKG